MPANVVDTALREREQKAYEKLKKIVRYFGVLHAPVPVLIILSNK